MAGLQKVAPGLSKKLFQQHVGILKSGRKAAPKNPPTFVAWRRVLWQLKERFEFVKSEEELDENVQILFLLGGPDGGSDGGKLGIQGLRTMLHCLDPYVLDSEVEAMLNEVLAAQPELPRHEKPAVPQKTISAEDLRRVVRVLMLQTASAPDTMETMSSFSSMSEDLPPSFPHSHAPSHAPDEQEEHAHAHARTGTQASAHTQASSRKENTHTPRQNAHTPRQDTHTPRHANTHTPRVLSASHHYNEFVLRSKEEQSYDVKGLLDGAEEGGASGGGAAASRPWHKALALSLANKQTPLMKCILKPHQVLEEKDAQRRDKERRLLAAETARREELTELLSRMKKPTRDKYGRTLLGPKLNDRNNDQVWENDPRQVDRRVLLKGPNKSNVKAFLELRNYRKRVDAEVKVVPDEAKIGHITQYDAAEQQTAQTPAVGRMRRKSRELHTAPYADKDIQNAVITRRSNAGQTAPVSMLRTLIAADKDRPASAVKEPLSLAVTQPLSLAVTHDGVRNRTPLDVLSRSHSCEREDKWAGWRPDRLQASETRGKLLRCASKESTSSTQNGGPGSGIAIFGRRSRSKSYGDVIGREPSAQSQVWKGMATIEDVQAQLEEKLVAITRDLEELLVQVRSGEASARETILMFGAIQLRVNDVNDEIEEADRNLIRADSEPNLLAPGETTILQGGTPKQQEHVSFPDSFRAASPLFNRLPQLLSDVREAISRAQARDESQQRSNASHSRDKSPQGRGSLSSTPRSDAFYHPTLEGNRLIVI